MKLSLLMDSLKKYDFSFLVISAAIFVMGCVNLFSATHAHSSAYMANLYKTQLAYYGISLFAAMAASLIRPKTLFRYAYLIYVMNVFLLILVLILGHKGMGAQRWLLLGPLRIQPSELMKVSSILILARWFAKRDPDKEVGFRELVEKMISSIMNCPR